MLLFPLLSPCLLHYCSSGERGLLPFCSRREGRNSNKKLKSRSNRKSMFRSSRCILMCTLSNLDTRTIKHISHIHPRQHVPLMYRHTYFSCHTISMSIWLCSTATAMDRKIEPFLLSLTTGQACSASKATCSLFATGKHPIEAIEYTQEKDSSKSK